MLTYEEWRSVICYGKVPKSLCSKVLDTVDDNGMNHDKLGKFAAKSGSGSTAQLVQHHLGPSVKLTGREVSNEQDPGINMKKMRDDARNYVKKHPVAGTYENKKAKLRLEVRESGIEETIQHGGGPDKLRAIAAIPEIVRSGTVVYNGQNPKNIQGRLVVLAKPVDVGGVRFVATAGFRDGGGGSLFYVHEMMDMKRVDDRFISQPGAAALPVSGPAPASTHLNDYTIRFLLQQQQKSP